MQPAFRLNFPIVKNINKSSAHFLDWPSISISYAGLHLCLSAEISFRSGCLLGRGAYSEVGAY